MLVENHWASGDESGKIISTTYYKLDLVLKDSESLAEDTVIPYESVTITPIDANTYFTSDKKIFVDILNTNVVFISVEGNRYLISERKRHKYLTFVFYLSIH